MNFPRESFPRSLSIFLNWLGVIDMLRVVTTSLRASPALVLPVGRPLVSVFVFIGCPGLGKWLGYVPVG